MSLLSNIVLGLSKEVITEVNKSKQYDSSKLVPLKNINLLKKYPFQIQIKKPKQGYQMLVFFTDKRNQILVYATRSGELELTTKTVQISNFRSKRTQEITSISFVDDKSYKRFANWCGKLRNGNEILNESQAQRKCADNF